MSLLKFSPNWHFLDHQHQMIQHAHLHAFTPFLHQPVAIPSAPMETQDNNFQTHFSGGTLVRPLFAPIATFQRTQKSLSPESLKYTGQNMTCQISPQNKRGRWGALHVCIAWKIYYHEKFKKIQHEDQTCSLSDKMKHKDSDGSMCINCNLDSPHGNLLKTAENLNHLKRSNPSDLHTCSLLQYHPSCQSGTMKREELEHSHELQRDKLDDKERNRSQQINKTKDLPLRDGPWDQILATGLDGWLGSPTDRKQQRESDSFVEVKRLKRESVEASFNSSHIKSVHQMRELSALYPYSNRVSVSRTPSGHISYPGAELHSYQTMWDSKKTDLYWRQNVLRDHSSDPCRVIRIPAVSQRHKDAFGGYSSTPLHFPLAVRQQEMVYSRGREFLHPYQQKYRFYRSRSQIPHPGFLQTSHFEH